ncbi:hypothetical protein MON38_10920 [Hymenobacter sp. DH14]|uniref:STAS/SEC14 domain-containing protein n=1 Tax=Hymenobacter cyanobacteriorum TaxID=2926463 RepID=A0A9X1VFQ9_9BACT|nr:hypothetical protein [Hymenobacter cyanobacteriorum]MCI1187932.1 hypothetical protein [Hymenobacter cyanobacteriorum]
MPQPAALPLLFTNAAGQLHEDPAGFLRATWGSAPRPSAAVQELFERMLLVLQHRQWARILVNQSQMRAFTPEEQRWVAHDWLPRAVVAGYRYGAVVVSPVAMVRLATSFITTSVMGLPLTYRSFDDEAEAESWLEQQPG